jgi:hypothetical protein
LTVNGSNDVVWRKEVHFGGLVEKEAWILNFFALEAKRELPFECKIPISTKHCKR